MAIDDIPGMQVAEGDGYGRVTMSPYPRGPYFRSANFSYEPRANPSEFDEEGKSGN